MSNTEVLIAGAGPTGLVLALWLTKLGVQVRIVDKAPEAGTTSRALAVQARTLELYRQLDLTEAVLAKGHRTPAVNLWAKGRRAARIPFEVVGEGLTPYPFLHVFPQDEHERLLAERLAGLGVTVERGVALTAFEDGEAIVATLSGPSGETTCRALYLAGCDGARSVVRQALHAGFPGGTYHHLFYVADVEAAGPAINGELHIDLDEADFLGVFPLAGEGHARLVGTVRQERADDPTLRFEDVSARAIDHMKVEVRRVNWFSTYHVHHRVTDRFRSGRAFLLGDAAHIHSPAGGQGMNTGIGDAINLAWKLAAVLRDRAADRLLDSFEAERIGFARRLVATTDRAFTLATADGPAADFVRTRLAPVVIGGAMSIEAVRDYAFRTVSQITLDYRGSPLSAGQAGHVRGGDRLPWASGGEDNLATLAQIDWQVHVYGAAAPALAAWCATHRAPLHVFDWRGEHGRAGLERDALYLVRPDGYVALAAREQDPASVERYLSQRSLRPWPAA